MSFIIELNGDNVQTKAHFNLHNKTAAHQVAFLLTKFIVTWMLTQWAASFRYSVFMYPPRKRMITTCTQNIIMQNLEKVFAMWYNKAVNTVTPHVESRLLSEQRSGQTRPSCDQAWLSP